MNFYYIIPFVYYTKYITANDIIRLVVLDKNIQQIIYKINWKTPIKINLNFIDDNSSIKKYFISKLYLVFQNSVLNNNIDIFNNVSDIVFDNSKFVTNATLEHINKYDLHSLTIIQDNVSFSLCNLHMVNLTLLKLEIYINKYNMRFIMYNEYIRYLDLSYCSFSKDIDNKYLFNCHIQHLNLQNTIPPEISLRNLIELKYLNLSNASINNKYLLYLPHNLDILILTNTDISSIDNLECFGLTELYLDGTDVQDIGHIRQFTKLSKFYINHSIYNKQQDTYNYYNKSYVKYSTIQLLSELRCLSILDISGCITNEQQLKFLETLNIDEIYVNSIVLSRIGLTYLCNVKKIYITSYENKYV